MDTVDALRERNRVMADALRQILQGARSQTAFTGMGWRQVEQIALAALGEPAVEDKCRL